jgi:hypothetical protein
MSPPTGPRDRPGEAERCEKVRRIATAVDWPCTVQALFRPQNLGLQEAVRGAITRFFEKSQIQALDRTQPGLPIKPGRCQAMTHDYKRHGTTP